MHVNDLLRIAVERGASDLHLKSGSHPMMRLHGALVPASEEKRLTHEDTVAMAAAIMSTAQRQKFNELQEIDIAYGVQGLGRFRCNIFQHDLNRKLCFNLSNYRKTAQLPHCRDIC